MTGTHYPLIVKYRDILAGNGFVAGVAIRGRGLMVEEEDGVWFYGAKPGGISAGGASQKEAAAEFREAYQAVLFDIADESHNFDDFKKSVEKFFHETNEPIEQDWWEAVQAVREERVKSDWLPTESADEDPCVIVHELAIDHQKPADTKHPPSPDLNQPSEGALAA